MCLQIVELSDKEKGFQSTAIVPLHNNHNNKHNARMAGFREYPGSFEIVRKPTHFTVSVYRVNQNCRYQNSCGNYWSVPNIRYLRAQSGSGIIYNMRTEQGMAYSINRTERGKRLPLQHFSHLISSVRDP